MVALDNNIVLNILSSPQDLFRLVAEDFARRAETAVNAKGEFSVVLSGGSTPKLLFNTLTETKSYKERIPWSKIKFFFGDERYVPADNIESNYHMAYNNLFSQVPVSKKNIYKIPTTFSDPNEAAADYERTLRRVFHIKDNEFPKFDLVYLGLGEDGHTASLMPFSDVVMEYCKNTDVATMARTAATTKVSATVEKTAKKTVAETTKAAAENYRLVAALWFLKQKMYRITLTPPAINNAENVIFLAIGLNKADALQQVLEGPAKPQEYPAQLIHCRNNKTIWYLDRAAANKL